MGYGMLSPAHCEVDGSHILLTDLVLFFNSNVYLSPTMLYINFGVDTVKIHRVDVTLLLLSG